MEAVPPTPPLTGNRVLDAEHARLFDDLAGAARLEGEAFRQACYAIFKGIELDFRHEESQMEAIGYPALAVHREQHARVLGGLHHAEAALLRGDAAPARRCIELLPSWLELHIATEDAPLALALELADSGGTPPSPP